MWLEKLPTRWDHDRPTGRARYIQDPVQSGSLDIGVEKGMQIQSSGLVRRTDLVHSMSRKQDTFTQCPGIYSEAIADRLFHDPWLMKTLWTTLGWRALARSEVRKQLSCWFMTCTGTTSCWRLRPPGLVAVTHGATSKHLCHRGLSWVFPYSCSSLP